MNKTENKSKWKEGNLTGSKSGSRGRGGFVRGSRGGGSGRGSRGTSWRGGRGTSWRGGRGTSWRGGRGGPGNRGRGKPGHGLGQSITEKTKDALPVLIDEDKRKTILEYKKLKLSEGGKGNKDGLHGMPNEPLLNKTLSKRKHDLVVASRKGQKIMEEREKRRIEREEQEKIRLQKIRKRKASRRKLSERTSKGQPVMKHRINFLLDKIQSNKELYCKKTIPG